ncbi:hypothetical protein [Hwanghaeella sp.]|uniref:hypothetical protein n=1 Tax=Hwanghaeella sp. TaxID=2605943 RepID=UPI003CCC1DD8
MRQIALLGLTLCVISLLLSAQAAGESVGDLVDRGVRFISELSGSEPEQPYDASRLIVEQSVK